MVVYKNNLFITSLRMFIKRGARTIVKTPQIRFLLFFSTFSPISTSVSGKHSFILSAKNIDNGKHAKQTRNICKTGEKELNRFGLNLIRMPNAGTPMIIRITNEQIESFLKK